IPSVSSPTATCCLANLFMWPQATFCKIRGTKFGAASCSAPSATANKTPFGLVCPKNATNAPICRCAAAVAASSAKPATAVVLWATKQAAVVAPVAVAVAAVAPVGLTAINGSSALSHSPKFHNHLHNEFTQQITLNKERRAWTERVSFLLASLV